MKRIIGLFVFFILSCATYSQSGGDNIFDFLNLPMSARAGALGGQQISIYDADINFIANNPSLLSSEMTNHLAINYINYMADINYAYLVYGRTFKRLGNFGLGMQYLNYGSFTSADEWGNKGSNFKANDYTFNLYYSRSILDSLLSVGATLKAINSKYEIYNSFGLALDAGVTYHNEDKLFTAAFVMKNLGFQLNTYSSTAGQEPLPFELQLGISQKLAHAPFRFSILAHHLETPNLRYSSEIDDDNIDLTTGEAKEDDKFASFADNVFRHVIFGLEFLPTKNFHIDLGYNYKRRQELKIADKPGFSGISFGFGLKLYKFRLSYSHASYHLAGVSDQFSVNINLSEFSKAGR